VIQGIKFCSKIQSDSESLQIEQERRPHRHEPNATRLGSNRRRMREISRSVQNDKQAKKNVLTVQSVQSIRMLMWQTVRHVAGPYDMWQETHVDSWHMMWLVCGEWDGDTWPNQWFPRVTWIVV
jgi:hypothetical protein